MAKRTKKADTSGKRTIHLYAQAWAELVSKRAQLEIEAELSGEFQIITRATDVLLRVRDSNGHQFLVLIELQLRYDANMPRRLVAYAALAREKYKLEVYVAVIYLLEPPPQSVLAQQFHSEFMGQTAHQDFDVIRIWDLAAADVLAVGNPALLPFVPLMRGGATIETLQACVERIRQEPEVEELEVLLAAFASFVLDTETVKQILRWNMKIIHESPLYKELFKDYEQGLADGLTRGREEGREEGRDAVLFTLRHFVAYRFHVALDHFDAQFQKLDLEAIKQLTKITLDVATLAEFEAALAQLQPKPKADLHT